MSDEADRWRELNRANWDERTRVHLGPGSDYDLASLRAGHGKLNAIEERELGDVRGLRVLHLQCHFGADTLKLAQRGATVVGLDFSPAAIEAARGLASELGLAGSARFVLADLYDAPAAIPEPASFDLVFVTWGATCWLPDIRRWAAIVASFLKPGGRLYYADAHPTAYVFDDEAKLADGRPGFFAPYLGRQPVVIVDHRDYADPTARLANATNVEWLHPLSDTIGGLIEAGLMLDWLHEHPQVPWRMFQMLVKKDDGDWHCRTSRGCRSRSRCRQRGADQFRRRPLPRYPRASAQSPLPAENRAMTYRCRSCRKSTASAVGQVVDADRAKVDAPARERSLIAHGRMQMRGGEHYDSAHWHDHAHAGFEVQRA